MQPPKTTSGKSKQKGNLLGSRRKGEKLDGSRGLWERTGQQRGRGAPRGTPTFA